MQAVRKPAKQGLLRLTKDYQKRFPRIGADGRTVDYSITQTKRREYYKKLTRVLIEDRAIARHLSSSPEKTVNEVIGSIVEYVTVKKKGNTAQAIKFLQNTRKAILQRIRSAKYSLRKSAEKKGLHGKAVDDYVFKRLHPAAEFVNVVLAHTLNESIKKLKETEI
jgi:hypothetical protein